MAADWCDHLIPASFDENENPVGICCELLLVAEGKLFWMEIERESSIQPQIPKPIPVV